MAEEGVINEGVKTADYKLTTEGFNVIPKHADMHFLLNTDGVGCSFRFLIEEDKVRLELALPLDYPIESVPAYFTVDEERRLVIYPPNQEPLTKAGRPNAKPRRMPADYFINGHKPNEVEGKPVPLPIYKLALMVQRLTGEQLIVYTGAGISVGGEKPVWNMPQLKEVLKIPYRGSDYTIKGFINRYLEDPDGVLMAVSSFSEQLFADYSTPAHGALAKLIEDKPGAVLYTENLDHKHEAEGSRIKPKRFGGSHSYEGIQSMEDPKILITVGLSHDDRGVIEYLKEQHPGIIIVAFTLSEETKPNYLGDEDFMVVGDCQETLPELARILEEKE